MKKFCITTAVLLILNILLRLYIISNFDLMDVDKHNHPAICISVHYTSFNRVRKEMIMYDNDINVGNETINAKLERIISDYRNDFHSSNPPDVIIREYEDWSG